MSLPAPNLDDRRFQDIVDEAKRRIPRHCPEWTDHNVSDPGVALVELFAWMTEMTLYRLNQVPDRLYVKFLELVGVELFSAVPARVDLLFRLTAPRDEAVRVPAGTQVSTERSGDEEPVVFLTDDELQIDTAAAGRLPDPRPAAGSPTTGTSCAARRPRCGSSRRCARTRRSTSVLPDSAAGQPGAARRHHRPGGRRRRPAPPAAGLGGVGRPGVARRADPRRHQRRLQQPGRGHPAAAAAARDARARIPAGALAALPAGPGRSRVSRSTATRRNSSRCPRWRSAARSPRTTPSRRRPSCSAPAPAGPGRSSRYAGSRCCRAGPTRRSGWCCPGTTAPASPRSRSGRRSPTWPTPPRTTASTPGPAPPARSGSGHGVLRPGRPGVAARRDPAGRRADLRDRVPLRRRPARATSPPAG